MTKYQPATIESHWQQRWEADGLYRAVVDWSKPKYYALTMLPYPSGDIHIGHWYAMTPSDARARFKRMQGYNVLFPMGFDAFGLPAENAAVQRNIHPAEWTWANIERMREQIKSMGCMFDWEREAISCEPAYYKWSQCFFNRFLEAGIAYRGEAIVNWSPTLQTVLANEQVIDGKDERTGQPVIQRKMAQWFFAITTYADELLSFDGIDWPEPIQAMQRNWIGRSEGAEVDFRTESGDLITVFTTRPDTLWGATFMVLAPEHELVDVVTTPEQEAVVGAYRTAAAGRSEVERMETDREKTGVPTGGYAINPVNQERIPIWIADYVLMGYGTGAIMAVPAHDDRDFAFARSFGLLIVPVIHPDGEAVPVADEMADAFVGAGRMINSGPLDGTPVTSAKGRANPSVAAAIDWLEAAGAGKESVNYRMRDWLISRQRYWGSPIPVLYRADGTIEPVLGEDLPVVLPEDVVFGPGASPLTTHEPFLGVTDSNGNAARRETDTLDTFMCSSWYQYRYLSPDLDSGAFDPEEAAYWLPVDTYTGGAEHATMHLLYTRFFTKAMRDTGVFKATIAAMESHGRDPDALFDEPMRQLRNQGQILGGERPGDRVAITGTKDGEKWVAASVVVGGATGDVVGELMRRTENLLQVDCDGTLVTVEVPVGAKVDIPAIAGTNDVTQLRHHLDIQRMSKSKGNVVNPDDLVAQYGTDTVRTHLMFAFDWEKGGPWDSQGIIGSHRFLGDVWKLATAAFTSTEESGDRSLRRAVHQAIAKVTGDLESFSWNTAVAALMQLRNDLQVTARSADVSEAVWNEAITTLLLLLAPIAPHLSEELWHRRGNEGSVHAASWPAFDADAAAEDVVTLIVQVNGKVRDRVDVAAGAPEADARAAALAADKVQAWLASGEVRKVIVVPDRLVNIVVG